jgi:hypothetical protein
MKSQTNVLDYTMIALAALLGIGSIVLLVMGEISRVVRFGWSETNTLLWDTFLSFLFFIQHSGMVRKSFRARLGATVAPIYHGAIYTIASGIALIVVVLFWQKSGITFFVLEGTPRLIASVCSILAIGVFALSAYSLRTFDPLGIGPLRARLRSVDFQPGPFVVRGPYRWVRHPLYSCILVLFWATPDVTADRLLFNVLWTGWIWVGALLEERGLAQEFGDAYRRYQKAVPMLIPWRGPAPATAFNS